MTRAELVAIVEAERHRAHDAIDAAYWAFTRQARALPPVCAVPWAYTLRAEMDRRLRALRKDGT